MVGGPELCLGGGASMDASLSHGTRRATVRPALGRSAFRMSDIAIVGAGVIGLASACELRKRGADVTVFERDEAGHAASWAAAGMLAPYSEALGDAALETLCLASLERYPAFVAELAERSSVDAYLRLDGTIHLAFDETDEARLEALAAAVRTAPRMLSRAELLEMEPMVSKHAIAGLSIEGEGHVDNRRLGRALLAAALAAGVRVEERAGDIAVESDARRILGLRTARGFRPARIVVNATGAWAGGLPGVAVAVPVTPKKGQMAALAVPRGFARRLVWTPDVYLVPRADGRLLIGATVEDAGFDQRVTAEGVATLLAAALRAAPSLGSFALSETWAGLRPASADGRPFIGATSVEGYFVASGHYRNGILLTPVTAELLADAIEGRPPKIDAAPFDPRRTEQIDASWNRTA
jgi:glycine oxidase